MSARDDDLSEHDNVSRGVSSFTFVNSETSRGLAGRILVACFCFYVVGLRR